MSTIFQVPTPPQNYDVGRCPHTQLKFALHGIPTSLDRIDYIHNCPNSTLPYTQHTSFHFGVGIDGAHQYIDVADTAYSFVATDNISIPPAPNVLGTPTNCFTINVAVATGSSSISECNVSGSQVRYSQELCDNIASLLCQVILEENLPHATPAQINALIEIHNNELSLFPKEDLVTAIGVCLSETTDDPELERFCRLLQRVPVVGTSGSQALTRDCTFALIAGGGGGGDGVVTGGSYNSATEVLTLTRSLGLPPVSINLTGARGTDSFVTALTFNTTTNVLTATRNNGLSPLTVDLSSLAGAPPSADKFAVSGVYNVATNNIIVTNNDGTSFNVDLSAVISQITCNKIATGLPTGVYVAGSTLLLGADCQKYSIPISGADVFVASAVYTDLTKILRITLTNGTQFNVDLSGLEESVTCSAIMTGLPTTAMVAGTTKLLGDDCTLHTFPTVCAQFAGAAHQPYGIDNSVAIVQTDQLNNCSVADVPFNDCLTSIQETRAFTPRGFQPVADYLRVRRTAADTSLIPATDGVILVDASGGSRTVTLIAPAACNRQDFRVKRIDLATGNNVTITYARLDGGTSIILDTPAIPAGLAGDAIHVVYERSTDSFWIL